MGIAETFLSYSNVLRWNYLKNPEQPTFVSTHNIARQVWIDPKDPTYSGRPA